jgi:hypothetical protein
MITNIFLAGLIVTFVVGYDVAHTETPVVKAETVVESPVPSPTPFVEPTDIEGYIRYKFGADAPKAFLLLQGDGTPGACAENRKLNPEAVNDNKTWGGVGADRGYWQINDVYHPTVSDACAKDVKCSTDYAFRMFTNDHNSFVRWTCGREYGI